MKKTIGALVRIGDSSKIEQEIKLDNESLVAPIFKGDILGKANYYIDGSLIKSINLVAENDIPKKNFLSTFGFLSELWLNLLK